MIVVCYLYACALKIYSKLKRGFSAEQCRFCMGNGSVVVELGGGEKEVSRCINCDGVGSLTCTTCQGSGIQPRYLDRRYMLSSINIFNLYKEIIHYIYKLSLVLI